MTEQLKRDMSLRDVERMTGVSKATVSRFLNSGHDISLSTAKKLLPVLSKCPCCDRADTRSSLSHVSREEILQHLDLSQNHEAGLIPMATQILLQKIADAILPHIGGAVTVKPLEWSILGAEPNYIGSPHPYQIHSNNGGSGAPDDPFVKYNNFRVFEPFMMGCVGDEFETIEEAKAAAQADYERRILSALTPASEPDTGNTDPMTIAKYDDELRKARPAPVWREPVFVVKVKRPDEPHMIDAETRTIIGREEFDRCSKIFIKEGWTVLDIQERATTTASDLDPTEQPPQADVQQAARVDVEAVVRLAHSMTGDWDHIEIHSFEAALRALAGEEENV